MHRKFQIRGAEGFKSVGSFHHTTSCWYRNKRPHLFFPVSFFVLSERCTENPVSSMAESGTIADIQVSVRQITQQSLVSRWYEIRARSSQSLLSSDWTLASKMVGRGGRKARCLKSDEDASSLPSFPPVFPRLCGSDKGFWCRVCEQGTGIQELKVRFALRGGGTNV